MSKRLTNLEIAWTESSRSIHLRPSQIDWLINRVKELTKALEKIAGPDTDATYDGNEFLTQDLQDKLQWHKEWRYKAKDLAREVLEKEK